MWEAMRPGVYVVDQREGTCQPLNERGLPEVVTAAVLSGTSAPSTGIMFG
jgi:hypothetical protein